MKCRPPESAELTVIVIKGWAWSAAKWSQLLRGGGGGGYSTGDSGIDWKLVD